MTGVMMSDDDGVWSRYDCDRKYTRVAFRCSILPNVAVDTSSACFVVYRVSEFFSFCKQLFILQSSSLALPAFADSNYGDVEATAGHS